MAQVPPGAFLYPCPGSDCRQVLMRLLARLGERNNTIPSASASHPPHHLPLRPRGKWEIPGEALCVWRVYGNETLDRGRVFSQMMQSGWSHVRWNLVRIACHHYAHIIFALRFQLSVNDTFKVRQELLVWTWEKWFLLLNLQSLHGARQCVVRMPVPSRYFSSWEEEDDSQEFKTSDAA